MPKEKAQLKCLIKSVEGEKTEERTITFVASSAEQDRHYERVDTASLRLPLKGGGEVIAESIGEDGVENIDIPLMLNHSFDVTDVIGSVRKAYFVDGELIFEAGLSNVEKAQEILQLIEEGHLDNAFSITMSDFDYNEDSGVISNAEIIEVSVVFRGANKEARLLAVKSVEGVEILEQNEDGSFKATIDGKEVTLRADNETAEEAEESEEETKEEVEESTEAESATETDGESVAETEEKSEEPTETTEEQPKEEKEMKNEIAKEAIVTPTVSVKETTGNYRASKEYEHEFAKAIVECQGKSTKAIKEYLVKNFASKGITGDAILPTSVESIFFETWDNQSNPLSTFRRVNGPAVAMYAFSGTGEGIRAKGHKKGEQKAQQQVTTLRRDLKQKIVYKRLDIDLQDLLDDTTGELNRFRVRELSERVLDEICRGAITGDGRTAGNADYRVFDGTRGLWSMAADIAAPISTENAFANAIANSVDNVATDNLYDKIKKTLAQVKDKGQGKSIIVPTGSFTDMELAKKEDGSYIFAPGVGVETYFRGVNIYEADWMNDANYDVIGWANQSYALFTSNEMVRTAFNLDDNTDAMLVERSVAGSAFGSRAVAGYVKGNASA